MSHSNIAAKALTDKKLPLLINVCGFANAQYSIPGAFLSRFRTVVNDVTGMNEQSYHPAITGVTKSITPTIDTLAATAGLSNKNPPAYASGNNAYAFPTPVVDVIKNHQAGRYPVASFVSNAAASSTNRIGNFISEAPLANALASTTNNIISQTQEVANSGYPWSYETPPQAPQTTTNNADPTNNEAYMDDVLTAALIQTAIDSMSEKATMETA
ncbi:hypothetical protein IE077_000760 [Cardiosporidium cionae]|uniref:Uncharacterized protein n=1 Tax=Cardiosporidium cionae TaxID=476202 RepID=A0ABQ7JE49_9APIC|nr:hypothetical protein IE077_000760 [Cardiosporidium cionae]|eukprot:KAF8822228.1 hypothetical protein IE077_000760 [Cardiosporidium cionae]